MNTDIVDGAATRIGGQIKETVGGAIGDRSLQADGAADRVAGSVQQALGEAIDAAEAGIRPLLDNIRRFSRDRPFAAAAVAGVLGIAVLNTLRGR
jgi:uncharacterized protein YjbJ (UPF0337 family)